MGQNKRKRNDGAPTIRYRVKGNGRFISEKRAIETLQAESQATCALANNENEEQHDPIAPVTTIAVIQENRGGYRVKGFGLDARSCNKIKRLQSDLAAERERSQNLVNKLAEKTKEVLADRLGGDGVDTTQKNRELKYEISKLREQIRKARYAAAAEKALAAAKAADVAKRIRDAVKQKAADKSKAFRDSKPCNTRKITIPTEGGVSNEILQRRRYDFVRRQAFKLREYFEAHYSDGGTGCSVSSILTYYLDQHRNLSNDIMLGLGVAEAIEQKVLSHLQKSLTVDKLASLRNTTGMTWEGYKMLSTQLFMERHPTTNHPRPVSMPFGGTPCLLPRTWRLRAYENAVLQSFGLEQSPNGITAWCDIIKLLEARLGCFPSDQLPTHPEQWITVFFGADAFRLHKANSLKAVLCVAKPFLERKNDEGMRLKDWAVNSVHNNLRMAIYEGSDCYQEFTTKGSIAQQQMQKLQMQGLSIHGKRFAVKIALFGDMSFLNNVNGGSGCAADRPCFKCDCQSKYLTWTKRQFLDQNIAVPAYFTRERRTMLAHAFGEAYGITEPYECPGCHMIISRHCQHPPISQREEQDYRARHYCQVHGRPPPQLHLEDQVCCSMHGEHNILAQTWFATVSCNIWDKKTEDLVATIVNETWKMKKHKIVKQTGRKAITKDSPHFNGPEGKVVCERRQEVLDVVAPPGHQDRELIHALWEAQDRLFECWRAPAPADASLWQNAGDCAQQAAEHYVKLFTQLCSASDGTVTMHYAMHHWPDDIRRWGSMSGINAQGMEAANAESKGFGKNHSSRQTVKKKSDGTLSRGRMGQILARSIMRQLSVTTTNVQKLLTRHVPHKPSPLQSPQTCEPHQATT